MLGQLRHATSFALVSRYAYALSCVGGHADVGPVSTRNKETPLMKLLTRGSIYHVFAAVIMQSAGVLSVLPCIFLWHREICKDNSTYAILILSGILFVVFLYHPI